MELWVLYQYTRDPQLRERLIVHYAPLVKYVAGQVVAGMPSQVERADLVSYGIFGLMDAVEKYDPTRSVTFEAYALTRIRGAILDGLRSVDWVPRSVRANARELQRAYETLPAALGRAPTEPEVAAGLGVTATELRGLFTAISAVQLVSLHQLPGSADLLGDPLTVSDVLPDPGAPARPRSRARRNSAANSRTRFVPCRIGSRS